MSHFRRCHLEDRTQLLTIAAAAIAGAPAISEDGIYGVVSECEANRAPVITLLAVAHSFIARQVPGLTIRPTL